MLFKPEHVMPILTGTKTVTRRIWKKRRAVEQEMSEETKTVEFY